MPAWAVFDVVIIGLMVLSAVMSIGRGLVREAFSVIAFAIGGLAAWLCVRYLEPFLKPLISPSGPSVLPAAILVVLGFFAAYSLAAFLGSRLSKLIHASPEIGAIDRIAGAAFGLARGLLAAVLFILLMHQVVRPGEEPDWIAKSISYPYLNVAAGWVGDGLTGVIEFFIGRPALIPAP